jgi:hypothetical protein
MCQTASTQTPIVVKSTLPLQHAEMMVEETLEQLGLVTNIETYANKEPETVLKLVCLIGKSLCR